MRNPRFRRVSAASALLLTFAADDAAARTQTAPSAPPAAAPAAAANNAAVVNSAASAFDAANLLLFSIQLGNLSLSDGLACYGPADDPYIPVGELTRLLEANVDVALAAGRVTGTLGEARRALLIDLPSHLARVGAENIPFADGDVLAGPSDIYVRLSLLQKLLPLNAKVDGQALTITLQPTEPFPVQSRLARLADHPDAGAGPAAETPLQVATPYRLFSPPGADVLIDAGARSTSPRFPLQYDVRLAGDLLYSDFQGYFASDETGKLESARALLQRRSVEGDLLGPLHARELDVGDVFTPALSLGPASVGGRGVTFSTVPFEQSNVFNRIDLRGELPSGYDVELYVNDVLRGSTNQSSNGLYEFLNVPLSPGVNIVRVVTYGPRGERNESVRVLNVGAGLLQKGDANFQFGAVEQNTTLLRLGTPAEAPEGSQTSEMLTGRPRIVGSFNYGLTNLLTVSGGAALTPQATGSNMEVYNLGLRTSLFGVATEVEAARDSKGGEAAAVGLAGSYHGVSAVLRQSEYRNGFVDENAIGANATAALDGRTELTVDTNLKLRGRLVPLSLRVLRDTYADGTDDLSATGQVSGAAGGVLYSTGFEYTRPVRSAGTLSGYLTASTFKAYAWQLRATLDYQLVPDFRPRLLTLALDHPISDRWSAHLSIGEPLNDLSGVTVSLSAVDQTRFGDLSLIGAYDNSAHAWRLATELNFGLGYNPATGRYQIGRSGPGSSGSLLLDAFVDENGDGIHEAGEPAVSKVQVESGGRIKPMTGEDGTVLVAGVGAGPTGAVRVNLESIDNPSVASPPSTIQFNPRPGSVTRVAYPLRPTGDIGVRVELLRDDGQTVGLSATRIRLTPNRGGKPVEGVTEYDGSVVFNQLPAGTYKVELDPAQAAQLRMHMLKEVSVTIKSDGSFTNDAVAQVKFDPPSTVATAETPTG